MPRRARRAHYRPATKRDILMTANRLPAGRADTTIEALMVSLRCLPRAILVTSVFLACVAMAWTAAAQQPSDPEVVQRVGAGPADVAAPPHISFVDGSGTVDRDGISEPAVTNAPFEPGDRLRTAAGRVEILFP